MTASSAAARSIAVLSDSKMMTSVAGARVSSCSAMSDARLRVSAGDSGSPIGPTDPATSTSPVRPASSIARRASSADAEVDRGGLIGQAEFPEPARVRIEGICGQNSAPASRVAAVDVEDHVRIRNESCSNEAFTKKVPAVDLGPDRSIEDHQRLRELRFADNS